MHTRMRSPAGRGRDGLVAHIGAHLVVNPLGRPAQADLTQSGQVTFAEKILDGAAGLLRDIDFPFFSPVSIHPEGGRSPLSHWFVQRLSELFHTHGHAGDLTDNIIHTLKCWTLTDV
jgi:hypothetical protein